MVFGRLFDNRWEQIVMFAERFVLSSDFGLVETIWDVGGSKGYGVLVL